MRLKVVLNWSGGKDCAMALYTLAQSESYEVLALLTTLTKKYNRISMHGVSATLLQKQAEALSLPIEKIYIKAQSANDEYEAKIKQS